MKSGWILTWKYIESKIYTEDERFRVNIDRHGNGTAQFVANAIKAARTSIVAADKNPDV